jgi:hypothetical protein
MAAFTFKHHGIEDGDSVYVVRPSQHAVESRKSESRQGGRGALVREAGRLSDLSEARAELRAAAVERIEQRPLPKGDPTPTRLPERLDCVSSDPLPICWIAG